MTEPIDFLAPEPEAPSSEPPRYRVLGAHEIFAPLSPLSYLIHSIGLVGRSGPPHLVAGYGYSGKTLALQSLAPSLAAGTAVWGVYPPGDCRRVVHVDYEQGEFLTRHGYERLRRAMGVEAAELQGRLELIVKPQVSLKVGDRAHWRALMEGQHLIIVDALRGATPGYDENDSRIREPLDMLGDLSEETKCRALVIHHARKPTEGGGEGGRYSVRGSSAIYDASDSAYVLSAKKGDRAICVEHERAKSHGETVNDFALVITDEPYRDDPKGALVVCVQGAEVLQRQREAAGAARRQNLKKSDAARIRAILADVPSGVATMHLRELSGLSGERFHAAIMDLGPSVVVRPEKQKGKRSVLKHYLRERMPDDGQQLDLPGRERGNPDSN